MKSKQKAYRILIKSKNIFKKFEFQIQQNYFVSLKKTLTKSIK